MEEAQAQGFPETEPEPKIQSTIGQMTTLLSDRFPVSLTQAENLPSLPTVALEVIQLTQDDDCTIDLLAQTISCDPALAAKLLKLSNSSLFTMGQDVTTLSRAAMVLGLKTVKLMSLSFSLVESLPGRSQLSGEHARQGPDQVERAHVHAPHGGQGAQGDLLARKGRAVRHHQHSRVADGAESRCAERSPALVEERPVDGEQHIEEDEERLGTAGEVYEGGHDPDVEGNLEGREAVEVPDAPDDRRRDGRGAERQGHRPEEADPGRLAQFAAGHLEPDGDREAHRSEHQPAQQQPLGPPT